MSTFSRVDLSGPVDQDHLKALQIKLDSQSNRPQGPQVHIQDMRRTDVTFRDGQMTTTAQHRGHVDVSTPTPPGFVDIPGMGMTPIAAAIAGGVLPQGWTPGQPTPWNPSAKSAPKGTPSAGFSQPSGSHAQQNAEGPEGKANGQEQQPEDSSPDYLARKSAVEAASIALHQADQTLGSAVVDGLMNSAAESGEMPDLDTLPEGVSEGAVQQVVAGYVAQANDTLASIKTSVGGLEATLTDHELRRARQAVVAGDAQQLLELGHLSLNRLEQMPARDPEGLRQMVEGMRDEERKAVRYDEQRRDWTIKHPTYGEISFGAAVRLGVVYFD